MDEGLRFPKGEEVRGRCFGWDDGGCCGSGLHAVGINVKLKNVTEYVTEKATKV